MMPLPVLYSFRRCPYAIRARMAIACAGLQVELREVVLKDKPAEMLSVSPKGTVPVLVLPDGSVIDESCDIMLWALRYSDPNGWLNQPAIATAEQLIKENDFSFKQDLDRYKYADRYPELTAEEYRARAEAFPGRLERCLTASRYLCGDRISLVDVALFPFIRQFAFVDKPWFDNRPYPKLQRWLNRFLESDLFAVVMKKRTPWKRGGAPTVFPENSGCYSKEIG